MEAWNPHRIASWFREIGLPEKYAETCQKEEINGRALLLLASCEDMKPLISVLKLRAGPKVNLMEHLEPYLTLFERDKAQVAIKGTEVIKGWTCEELCGWLRELGMSPNYLTLVEEEEINGRALLAMKRSNELQGYLQLKVGSWTVLDHELQLNEKPKREGGSDHQQVSIATRDIRESKEPQAPNDQVCIATTDIGESKEPLAPIDPVTESIPTIPLSSSLSLEEEKLSLLKSALGLDVEPSKNFEERSP